MKTITERLAEIQRTLSAPKGQENKFGGYMYRSCEDILTAVKPLLEGMVITITDDMIAVADRVYVKATATISDGKETISTTAFAREADQKKGMDSAQVTGSTSSYARKYALNGLLLIDDNKDADHMDNQEKSESKAVVYLTERQIADITALAEEVNVPLSKICGAAKVRTLEEIPALSYAAIIKKLNATKEQA